MSLYETLARLDSEELIYKIEKSMFTEEAHLTALKILKERNVQTNHLPKEANEVNENVKSYGVETDDEKKLSNNSFKNFIYIFIIPLIPACVVIIFGEIGAGNNFFIKLLTQLIAIGINFYILKWFYKRMFEIEDKLNQSAKTWGYGTAILLTLFFTSGGILDAFGFIKAY